MSYTFDDIAGYEQEKAELAQLCEIIAHRDVYAQRGAKLPKGIVFYGETGTGKTLFAKVLADACGLQVIRIDLGDIVSEATVCRKIRRAFASAAKRKEPSMIFFDEIDKVLPNAREEYVTDRSKTILAQLLTLIDGMDSGSNFIFAATCNDYAALPVTLVRPGRIDKKMHIGLPSCSSRAAVLGLYMARSSCQFTLSAQDIAALCTGFSCAALETLVNECILHSDERGAVSEQLVHECITEIRHEDIPRRRPARKDLLDAYRNVGCFVVARTFNDGEYTLCLERDTVCNRYFDDILHDYDDDYHEDGDEYFDEDEDGEEAAQESEKAYYTKYDCLHALCALLGGYAAEEVLLHKVYDNVSASLWTADKLLLGMSFDGLIGPELRFSGSRDEDLPYARERVQAINAAFDGFMQECYRRAKAIVTANGELIEKLACMLAQQRTMGRQACEEVLSDLGGIRAAEE